MHGKRSPGEAGEQDEQDCSVCCFRQLINSNFNLSKKGTNEKEARKTEKTENSIQLITGPSKEGQEGFEEGRAEGKKGHHRENSQESLPSFHEMRQFDQSYAFCLAQQA